MFSIACIVYAVDVENVDLVRTQFFCVVLNVLGCSSLCSSVFSWVNVI